MEPTVVATVEFDSRRPRKPRGCFAFWEKFVAWVGPSVIVVTRGAFGKGTARRWMAALTVAVVLTV